MNRFIATLAVLGVCLFLFGRATQAEEAAPIRVAANPLPNGCIGVNVVHTPGQEAPVCCAFGYVFDGATGAPIEGAQVTIVSAQGVLNTTSQKHPDEIDPFYAVNLSDEPLSVQPGDVITVTATHNGASATTVFAVDQSGQQVDVTLPTQTEDRPPIATIHYIHPKPSARRPTSISFAGRGVDRDNLGAGVTMLRWRSNLDGELSQSRFFTLSVAALSPGIHNISLEAQDDEGNWSPAVTRPLTKMSYGLTAGWNVFSLEALPTHNYDSRRLMDDMTAQGLCPKILAAWQGDDWRMAVGDPPLFTFPLQAQTPYVVQSQCAGDFTLLSTAGLAIRTVVALEQGWTFVSLPIAAARRELAEPANMTAEAACAQIGAQGGDVEEIVRWNPGVGDWAAHPCGVPIGDFTMLAGEDYFIRATVASQWQVQPVAKRSVESANLVSHRIAPAEMQSAQVVISGVRIANLREKSASISWLTDVASSGRVLYGAEGTNPDKIAEDDRGAATTSRVHHVTIGGLSPETTYAFKVQSGAITDDNNGALYHFTTGPVLSIPGNDAVWGQVLVANGVTITGGALVYLRVADNDGVSPGQSALLSGYSDSDGYWRDSSGALNLAASRTEAGTGYFSYSPSGDLLRMEAKISATCSASVQVDTGADSPAAPILLPCAAPPATPTPTSTPTATPTPTGTPTATPTATSTATPTSTPTATPTSATLTPAMPVGVYLPVVTR